ncbi:formate dehydrogenase accessory sulfurtransferase FdhD [Rhodoferax sp.]|uniref:formate dehydrogenase accessory sulfurtransferase FdhD n=1 Tax=Rhodoferax sp. TaxID=50421 RepID=UPI00374D55AE
MVRRFPEDALQSDTVAAEVPVALVFNGISHAVMMATPQDLEAFALGFALSEGILDSVADCYGIEVQASVSAAGEACEVQLEVSSRCFNRLKERRRSLAGRTGCGVCGIDSLSALDLQPEPMQPQPWAAQLQASTVLRALQAMPALQLLNAACGSLHAAGWATPDGVLTDVLEDVGRHNALDKLLGRRAQAGLLAEPGFVVMSSRASYELVRKCARLNVAALATISAPTALAIRIADTAGLQLWGLCRDPRAVRYVPA